MVVEDDDIIRAATAEMLIALGHVVTQASSGEQALAD
ncbi:CheY-like chemotaxis protein [Variovorax sp. 3319]|nr:CheY-like chemotaxis protein [Variovorax sp. 3319]